MHKSFSFVASKLWNKLPIRVRNCGNLQEFKNNYYENVVQNNVILGIYIYICIYAYIFLT